MDEVKRIERREFSPTKTVLKREEGVGGVESTFSSSRFEKSFYAKLVEKKSQNENSRRKRKNEKKRTKKHRDRKLHFSKQTEREKNNVCILTKESILQLVLSQTRSFEEEERGQREASSFS